MPHVPLLLPILAPCISACRTSRPKSRIPQQEYRLVVESCLNSDLCSTGKMLLVWVMRYGVQMRVGTRVTSLARGRNYYYVLHLLQLGGWPQVETSTKV